MMFWVGLFAGTLFGLALSSAFIVSHDADIKAERWFYEQEQKKKEKHPVDNTTHHGFWIYEYGTVNSDAVRCSECNSLISRANKADYEYCPHCGSKMINGG